jgi:hypothetical protein
MLLKSLSRILKMPLNLKRLFQSFWFERAFSGNFISANA